MSKITNITDHILMVLQIISALKMSTVKAKHYKNSIKMKQSISDCLLGWSLFTCKKNKFFLWKSNCSANYKYKIKTHFNMKNMPWTGHGKLQTF